MKKLIGTILTLAVLAFAFPARADFLDFVRYNSTTAATDLAIDTGKITTAGSDTVTLNFKNSGAGARTAAIECWDPDKVVTVYRTTVSVGATSEASVNIGLGMSSATAPTGVTNLAMKPCHVMEVTAEAATGQMRTVIIQRVQRYNSNPTVPKQ